MTIHRTINGKPYTFIPNRDGYGVCAATSKTDRFHRSYQVYCLNEPCPEGCDAKEHATGRPYKCSCPSSVYGTKETTNVDGQRETAVLVCKHMRTVDAIYREAHPEMEQELQEELIRSGYYDETLARLNGEIV